MFPIWCATVVELTTTANGRFLRNFTMENFKFPEAAKWELKIFAPNYQKAHPYTKSNKSFGVCGSDVVLTLYGGERKKYARIAIGNRESSI